MKKKLSLLMFLLLIVIAIPVSAATTITPKYCDFTTSYSTANKYAKTVSTGDYRVNIKNASKGYIKFTPSTSGTYVFTVSGLKDSRDEYQCGNTIFQLKDSDNYLEWIDIKTQGGTADALEIATEEDDPDEEEPAELNLRSRSTKMSLEKGASLFLCYYFTGGDSFKLNIKRAGSSSPVYYLANANNHKSNGCYSSSFKVSSDKIVLTGKMKKVKGTSNYTGSYTSVKSYTFKLTSSTKYYGSESGGYASISKSQALNHLKKMKSHSYAYPFVMLVDGNKVKAMYLKS